jgi:hypothetical protein
VLLLLKRPTGSNDQKEIVVTYGQFLAEGDGVYLLRAAASGE